MLKEVVIQHANGTASILLEMSTTLLTPRVLCVTIIAPPHNSADARRVQCIGSLVSRQLKKTSIFCELLELISMIPVAVSVASMSSRAWQ